MSENKKVDKIEWLGIDGLLVASIFRNLYHYIYFVGVSARFHNRLSDTYCTVGHCYIGLYKLLLHSS